jgi:hypothetical protein
MIDKDIEKIEDLLHIWKVKAGNYYKTKLGATAYVFSVLTEPNLKTGEYQALGATYVHGKWNFYAWRLNGMIHHDMPNFGQNLIIDKYLTESELTVPLFNPEENSVIMECIKKFS